jgi:hypothetical protein
MGVYKDADQVIEVFGGLLEELLQGEKIKRKLMKNNLIMKFIMSDPEVVIWASHDQLLFGEEAAGKDANLIMEYPTDLAHRFYLKKISIGSLAGLKEVKIKGPLPKLMALVPLLNLLFEKYPDKCKEHGIPID